MRESERVSGRSTAKGLLVRHVSDLGHTANTGAHGKEVLCRVPHPWHTANLLSFHSNLETCFTKFNEMYVAKDYQIN